ncbi:histone-lysine N-methyltransferase SETMAR [Polyodon spathula]|nr:histone-lysine N-methyltransferase SETMAR [Polyodon spathula]
MNLMGEYDVCRGLENLPVSVERDEESLPQFQYSPEHVSGPGADQDPSEITYLGCDCVSTSCRPDSCSCLQHHGESYDENLSLRDCEGKETDFSRPVFECNVMCKCSEACKNRVVQRGLGYRLQMFKGGPKGWGLHTLEFIPKGRFVCQYAGEVIGLAEARRRLQSQKPGDMNYLIAVKEHIDGGKMIETFVDPALVGNVGRFLNHSCQPNLFMVPVRVNSVVPKLALFAGRDILAGEELMYDYSGRYKNVTEKASVQETTDIDLVERKPCYCGAESCCGFLPFDVSVMNSG